MARHYWFWRDTSRTPRFLGAEMWAAAPFAIFVMHMRLWTFLMAAGCMLILGLLSKFGYTVPVFVRMLKRKIAGPVVQARPWWYWNRFLRRN